MVESVDERRWESRCVGGADVLDAVDAPRMFGRHHVENPEYEKAQGNGGSGNGDTKGNETNFGRARECKYKGIVYNGNRVWTDH